MSCTVKFRLYTKQLQVENPKNLKGQQQLNHKIELFIDNQAFVLLQKITFSVSGKSQREMSKEISCMTECSAEEDLGFNSAILSGFIQNPTQVCLMGPAPRKPYFRWNCKILSMNAK